MQQQFQLYLYIKKTTNNIINSKHQKYPYQFGTCTLIKDPYPDDPRVIALQNNELFDKNYWDELPNGDILMKSLNCITNYHIVRPFIRFYANSTNNETIRGEMYRPGT